MGRPLVLAHRGACRVAPENTVEAIILAAEMGADGVELDVRMTADGHLVLCHDDSLAGLPLAVSSLDELRKVDLAGSRIPTLEEALEAAKDLYLNLELKRPGPGRLDAFAGRLMSEVSAFRGRLLVTSFFPPVLTAVASGLPTRASLGVLSGARYDPDGSFAMGEASSRGYAVALPEEPAVSAGSIQAIHSAGLEVITWTVDDPNRIEQLAAWGIDGIITNEPDRALETL